MTEIRRDLIETVLRAAFPDPKVQIAADAIDAVITAMQRRWQPEFEQHFGIPRPTASSPTEPAPRDGDASADFYLAHATHSRVSGPAQHEFIARLPCVRVRLPETPDDIQTGAGWAYAGDRLLHSMADVRTYLEEVGRLFGDAPKIDRCDLVTPPRLYGARFGAFGLYLLMREGRIVASVLEGGMATGQPRVLYWMPVLAREHTRRSWYQPTPDSSAHNFYRGSVLEDSDDPSEPDTVVIERFNADPRIDQHLEPVMRIRVTYEKLIAPEVVHPGELLLQAACRVAAVMDAMGRQMPDVGVLTPVLAEIGRAMAWHKEPKR